MSNEELVELMIDVAYREPSCSKETAFYRVLDCVKSHIGSVATLCDYPNCHFGSESYMMMGQVHYRDCPKCNGSGVIARGDK